MRDKYPIDYKTVEELVKEANELLAASKDMPEMTEQEEIEDDAEYGYFQDEDD